MLFRSNLQVGVGLSAFQFLVEASMSSSNARNGTSKDTFSGAVFCIPIRAEGFLLTHTTIIVGTSRGKGASQALTLSKSRDGDEFPRHALHRILAKFRQHSSIHLEPAPGGFVSLNPANRTLSSGSLSSLIGWRTRAEGIVREAKRPYAILSSMS